MNTPAKGTAPLIFNHPSNGPSRVDPSLVAVRWRDKLSADERMQALADAGLRLLAMPKEGDAPLVQVNQTDGLSWVIGRDDGPLPAASLKKLEASPLVQWVMPSLRVGATAPARRAAELSPGVSADMAAFTVNPSRLYVRQGAFDQGGGVGALPDGVTAQSGPARLRGYVTLQVDGASYAAGRTTLQLGTKVAASLNLTGPADLRYETIPLLSPMAHAQHAESGSARADGALSCRPPSGPYTPNDPMFGTQWALQRIQAPRGWQIARGVPSVTVAVIDQGVELGHPDLLLHPNSLNASNDLPDGSPVGNHGTPCAGIIGARMDNAQGLAGVAGGVQIMAIATSTWADVDIAEGLYFAADQGAQVVSMSFGVYASWGMWDFDLIRDALQYAHDQGLVLVAASGNENWNQSRFPGSDARTLCVGGSNRMDERKRRGDASIEPGWGASWGPDVDVVAPCLEITGTDRLGGAGYTATDYTERFNGTSSATPLVAGLAALLKSMNPTLSNVQVRSLIERSCDKISPALYAYANVAGKPSGTWNEEVGYGRVNVERALLEACTEGCDCDEGCSGCGGTCIEPTPTACRGPAPVPWLPFDRCMYFYEARTFDGGSSGIDNNAAGQRLRLRVTYQHCLKLIGRQQGPLLYTTTLLPGEQVRLFEYDRYRRTRAETQRVSVHTSLRQTLSALSQSRRSSASSAYFDTLSEIRTNADSSVSAGGGLAGFFGAPTVKGEFGVDTETTVASGGSVRTASEQFTQMALTASQAIEAERSLVISTFEDQEHVSTTARQLQNANHCYAVTYYVRRVMEAYEVHSRIESVEWRLGDGMPWRSVDDLAGLPDGLQKLIRERIKELRKDGDAARDPRSITVPTDGTVYEPELAHCASCEPVRLAEHQVRLEQLRLQARRACLETELLELEVERRRRAGPDVAGLTLGTWVLGGMAVAVDDGGPSH
jgi:thermitase